jgi:hypothetical protein
VTDLEYALLYSMLLSTPAFAIEQDKAMHATVSYAITITTYAKTKSYWKAAGLSLVLGATKEYVIDQHADNGDMVANGVGTGVGVMFPIILEF